MLRRIVLLLLIAVAGPAWADEIAAIPRRLPPVGVEIDPAERARLEEKLAELTARLEQVRGKLGNAPLSRYLPDVEIYHKAVAYALRHGEFFKPNETKKALDLIDTASKRLDRLELGRAPWTTEHGLVVRGFRSALDGSVQPYGLVIPEALDFSEPKPLYVWLHGRGDTTTDLNFITSRSNSPGNLQPEDAIVLHPFGRYCNGWKHAGEIDVLEAIGAVMENYAIDPQRIVLAGFSMGGAGAWHLGAHYTERWCAVHAGAGFAETARYQNLTPEKYPPWYEQTLWRVYDVPNYVRNLFNVPVIAYSGEEDRQIQAARVMEEAFQEHGQTLTHLIGPGMGHKYHPDVLNDIRARLAEFVAAGNDPQPERISLQTRTLRYNRYKWLEILALDEHWQDTRIDATATEDPRTVQISTTNVAAFRMTEPFSELPGLAGGATLVIDEDRIVLPEEADVEDGLLFERIDGHWKIVDSFPRDDKLRKLPRLQGPIDDAFLAPFLVVIPTGKSAHPEVDRWVHFETQHFLERWRLLMRGDARVKLDREVTPEDLRQYHVVLWGDPQSNSVLARLHSELPIDWSESALTINGQSYPAAHHVPMLIYPNPQAPDRYVVINSGLTFREAHDGTNSQQNPKLPDWAVIDLREPPSNAAPGRVVEAGFFDEYWQWK